MSKTILSEPVKMDFSKGFSQKQIASLLSVIRHSSNISESKFKQIVNQSKNIHIPISIFSKNLSCFESIVKFLRENMSMKNKDIADILKRDRRSISTTYINATKKINIKFKNLDYSTSFPLEIISQRKYSVLESIVSYLHSDISISLKKISNILHRDYITIWTVYRRAKNK